MPRRAPFGSWRSPLGAADVARSGVRLSEVATADRDVLWLEGRPAEGGRRVLMRRSALGDVTELTPTPFNVRTRVHEHGGGAYVAHDATVFCSDFADQRLYRFDPGEAPRPITSEPDSRAALRYADGRATPDGRLVICVRELHGTDGVVNELVAIAAGGDGDPRVLVTGSDFYAFPRVSPDGARLAWTQWEHPNMPWDGTELWTGALSSAGSLTDVEQVSGGVEESIFQPAFSPDGTLHFVSDRTGWWNLYRLVAEGVQALIPCEAEFGAPQWIFGLSSYDFLADGTIACAYGTGPARRIGLIEPGASAVRDLELDYVPEALPSLHAAAGRLAYVGASPSLATAVVLLDPRSGEVEVLARAGEREPDPAWVPVPRAIEFPTAAGLSAHAYYYPPRNGHFLAPDGELPPLIVESHGGPTGQASLKLDEERLFFTSRGFAVVDVDYGGSTGYGREYRDRLRGRWGIVDSQDCIAAARYLAEQGFVDPRRLIIRGASAGGYTTLCALAFHDVFAAGSSHYGVADAETLAQDTHKFESRYLDRLIGAYPRDRNTYRERSPIHFADRLSAPLILFQGLEDEVVPPEQAEAMVATLRRNGIAHSYLAFEGEQHGFRRAETVRRVLEAELYFFSRVFGFEPADKVEPVPIVGLG